MLNAGLVDLILKNHAFRWCVEPSSGPYLQGPATVHLVSFVT
jgi:hypothetical protein